MTNLVSVEAIPEDLTSSTKKKKIFIAFQHSPNSANPVQHPVVVLKNGIPVREWDSLICSMPDEICPLKGKQITVSGRWEDEASFSAYTVDFP